MVAARPRIRKDDSGTLEWLYDYVMSMRNFEAGEAGNMPRFGEIAQPTPPNGNTRSKLTSRMFPMEAHRKG